MVVAVVGCPPYRTFLSRRRSKESEDELKPTARLVASVREISVIDPSYPKHTNYVEGHADSEHYPAKPRPENKDAPEVNAPESELFNKVHWVEGIAAGVGCVQKDSPHLCPLPPTGERRASLVLE